VNTVVVFVAYLRERIELTELNTATRGRNDGGRGEEEETDEIPCMMDVARACVEETWGIGRMAVKLFIVRYYIIIT